MYQLTLTATERQSIDHIGDSYDHGYKLYRLLWVESVATEDVDWDHKGSITFNVPEHVAWAIHECGHNSEMRWDLFGPELAAKLTDFCQSVV